VSKIFCKQGVWQIGRPWVPSRSDKSGSTTHRKGKWRWG